MRIWIFMIFLGLLMITSSYKTCEERRLLCEKKCGVERNVECLLKCYQDFNNCYFQRER